MSIIIKNISHLVCSPARVEHECDVLIEDERIAAIGQGFPSTESTQLIDAQGCIVIPGLVNPHTHLYQNFIKGVAPNLTLEPWCDAVLFPMVGAIQEEFAQGNYRLAYLWSAIAGIEMIKGGITSCQNMDHMSKQAFEAWRDLGLKGVAAYTLANKWVPPDLRGKEEKSRLKVMEFIEEFHDENGLIQVALAPSTVFLCDDNLLTWVREKAETLNLRIQIHVAEIAKEVQDSITEYGETPVQRLERLALITDKLSAVHCVHINPDEISLLADRNVKVVHCPKSNMKLADGIAPVVQMLREGISVSIATDGCASNDLLDMWEEMRAALFLARVSNNDASALSAVDAFRMATVEGAQACGFKSGIIQPGYLADLAIIEPRQSHLRPFHADRLMEMLVFCTKAGDVRDTIINGNIVMRNRRIMTLDEEVVLNEADQVDLKLSKRRKELSYQHE